MASVNMSITVDAVRPSLAPANATNPFHEPQATPVRCGCVTPSSATYSWCPTPTPSGGERMARPADQAEVSYLTTKDVANRYRTTPATVRYWRHTGYGPRGIRIGRQVLYPVAELHRFETELIAQSEGQVNV
ncbi:helix-turn-helix transcriptional regulator [Kitasatospora aureofaciens]|uniref:helix-turn-helix transcriptional regulator n=1 Tax=Kitasatospora aureofaciens TaxID=1894 RepID=UPI0037FDE1CC